MATADPRRTGSDSQTKVSVKIGKGPINEFRDIEHYSIDSNVLTLADAADVRISNPAGARDRSQIQRGDPFTVYMEDPRVSGGQKVQILDGIVTNIKRRSDTSGGTTWDVSGADLGWHLVNNCGPLFKSLMNVTFAKFLDLAIDPSWGFGKPTRTTNDGNRLLLQGKLNQGRAAVAAAHTPVDTFIPPVCFEAGDMVADKLILYARRAKRLVNVSADGYLQIFQPNYKTPVVGTLHYHADTEPTRVLNNVKSFEINESIDGLYTDVVCVGTVALPSVMPNKFDPHAGTFKGRFQNPSILPFRRFLSFCDNDAMVKSFADDRAKWRAERGLFDSYVVQCDVFDHVLGGTFYTPDTMIAVNNTIDRINQNMYVSARRFSRTNGGGTTTSLTLRLPNLLHA